MAAGPALAAEDAAPPAAVGEVVVTGQTFALQRSITTKRDANVVSDTVASSEIGSIPDFGLGEALQRVPGVSFIINNGRGEAQFETVRGLNPDYNSVLIDGIALPSTEETRRQVSFDVLPSILANQVSVYKTYTVDQPTDAIGGITDLKTHSAFDHPGWFLAGHLDGAYWEQERRFHDNAPSGQGDVRLSKTFGADNQFGALVLLSYYQRSSNSLNSYSLPYSYYGYNTTAGGTQTVNATPLTPTTSVVGLTPLADRRRWYFYDNVRRRPGVFAKFEYDDHTKFHAHFTTGFFQHTNNEYRYSQYLNRGAATATFTSPTAASFATGTAETDYDNYNQTRQINYYEGGAGVDLDAKTRLDLVFNYALSFYRQDTTEDVFTTPASATFAANYVGYAGKAQLFQPANAAAFATAANYAQTYHLVATDKSDTVIPLLRIDYVHNRDADAVGLGYQAGYQHKETKQTYFYHENRLNPAAAVTLANTGPLATGLTPYDSGGLNLMFLNPAGVVSYIAANPGSYTVAASNTQRSTLNNFDLREVIDAGYVEASYRLGALYAQAGLRYETTGQTIDNYQPSPITSTTSFAQIQTRSSYSKLLPSLNVSYALTDTLKLRGAITQDLARPRYSDLGQNSALTLSGTTATETIANPHLVPRESTNYDLSLEFYPQAGTSLSAAVFDKEISHEIFALTTTNQNATLPGLGGGYTVITTTPSNVGSARVRGVEFGFTRARFGFLPGPLADFGLTANATLIDMDAPSVQMNDKVTYRKLPQLLESAKIISNVALLYNHGPFSGELAYNHTGKMPISFDLTNAVNDQWYRETDIVDVQVGYHFTPQLELRVQAKNLFDTTNQKVVGPGQNLNYSLLNNGRAYYLGVSFAY